MALPALVDGLKDDDVEIRYGCAEALAQMGSAAHDAVPALVELLKHRGDPARVMAGYALGEIGPGAAAAVPVLIEDLNANDAQIREWAAVVLGNIGPGAKAAIPHLIQAANGRGSASGPNREESNVQDAARTALWQIGSDAIPALHQALEDKDPGIRRVAIDTLRCFGSDAAITVPPSLIEALNDMDYAVRVHVLETLKELGPEANAAVPAIAELLWDRHPSVRKVAAEAMKKIDPDALRKHLER